MNHSDIRVLLATEGPSDDVVIKSILTGIFGLVQIDTKSFTSRGISVVMKAVPNVVRAAHFGYYGILVIHFDLNGTHNISRDQDVTIATRRIEVEKIIVETKKELRSIPRAYDTSILLATPCQSTDAWLCWGNEGGKGVEWEKIERHSCKTRLYGDPPRSTTEKALQYVPNLISRATQESEAMPISLRTLLSEVQSGIDLIHKAVG
jgi:hypothetical protein